MLALVPYFPPPVFNVFGIPLDSWSLLVSLAFIFGMEMARARAISLGLDIRDVVDGSLFIVGSGFVVGHLVHVLVYNPHQLDEQGWIVLLKIWAGFSSNGGFLGAIIGTVFWFRTVRPRKPFWLYADTMAYSLPFGWFLGRMGCFTAHDHVGERSSFFLAVDFPADAYGGYYGGPRHDLGLYEALYMIVISVVFYALRKRNLRHSFFAMLFCLMYTPVRFGLDFLRHSDLSNPDVRMGGFTPAQYGSLMLMLAGVGLLVRMGKQERYAYVWEMDREEHDDHEYGAAADSSANPMEEEA
jgi:phosphatidylglycerol---prolipoprotein diacylglyceryl transferase